MGIIKRQGIKSTLVNYVGAVVGAIAIFKIYPLNDEVYGYAQWLYSTAYLLVPMATGGVLSLIVKYFPSFKKADEKNYNGFLTLILSLLIFFFILFLGAWYLFKEYLVDLMEWANMPNANILIENERYIILLLAFMILLRFLIAHSQNILRIVVPDIIEKLGFKLYLPLLVLGYVYLKFDIQTFAYLLVGFFFSAVLLMIVYLKILGVFKFSKIKKPNNSDSYKEMGKYAFFGSLNQFSSSLATRLDSIMIPFLIDMTNNGFYGKASFIANVLDFPTRALSQIAAPIISKAWNEKDYEELNSIYKKASNNLFTIGTLIFLLIWYGLEDLIVLSANPAAFPDAKLIFVILASSKLVDMITSVNTHLIVYSSSYKFNMLFLLALGIANVYLNLKFIPLYGIVGAAIATAISLFAFNVLKLIFIQVKFGLNPFTKGNLKTFVLLIVFMFISFYLPDTSNAFLNLFYKCAFVGLAYIAIAYLWKISEDLNSMGENILKRINN